MRQLIFTLLGHLTHARFTMREMQEKMRLEMDQGHRPTLRGKPVDKTFFDLIDITRMSIELAFTMGKGLQWPEVAEYRTRDAEMMMHDILSRVLDLMLKLSDHHAHLTDGEGAGMPSSR